MKFNSLLWSKPPVVLQYGLAVMSVAVALMILLLMDETQQASAHLLFFICAVLFSSLVWGVGPGLVAIALSVLAIDYYFLPSGLAQDPKSGGIYRLLIFSLASIFAVVVCAVRNRSAQSLRRTPHEQEENFRAFVENAADQIIRYDREYRRTYVNPAVAKAYGVPRESFIGTVVGSAAKKIGIESFETKIETVRQHIRSVFDTGQPVEFEIAWPLPNESRIFSSHMFPEFDEKGGVKNVLGIARDITESKRAHEALRQSEADLAEAQRIAQIGSWSFDIAKNETRWSNELFRIFDVERTSAPVTYEMFVSMVHPEDRDRLRQVNADSKKTGEPFEVEYRIIMRNGMQKVIREIGYATKNDSGIVSRLFGTAQDITERKRDAEALSTSNQRFRALVENTSDGIELLDAAGKILYATPSTVRMLGYTLKEYIGKNVFDLFHDDDRSRMMDKLTDLLQSPRKSTMAETRIQHKNGHWLWVEGVGTNLLDDPSVNAIVVNYRDITERKRAEETIRNHSVRLQVLADISQTLSHRLLGAQENERRMIARELHDEIGQILTAIKIDLQVIGQRDLPEDLQTRIEDNIATLDRCLHQVRNLSLDLRPSVLDDLGLVAALHWQLHRQSERAGFKVHFVHDDLPGRLHTDLETTCFRIVQETLTNISRHAAARNVEVTLRVAGGDIQMSIRDDGKGFDVDAAMSEAAHGTTVGILSMRERVNLAGGTFEITSKEGEGTVVLVRFPLRLPEIIEQSNQKVS
ncbi:MAG: PAS domain S-box protein [Ignavibacteriales bacterium]|nr:PAS domain S-box protein [Ignavibacteriales bacterium]